MRTADRRRPIKLAQIVLIPAVVLLVAAAGIFAAFPFSTHSVGKRVECSPAIVSWTAHRDTKADELVKRYHYPPPTSINIPPTPPIIAPPLNSTPRAQLDYARRLAGAEVEREMQLRAEADARALHAAAAAIGVPDSWSPVEAHNKSTRMAACAKPAKTRLAYLGITAGLILLAAGLALLAAWRPRHKAGASV